MPAREGAAAADEADEAEDEEEEAMDLRGGDGGGHGSCLVVRCGLCVRAGGRAG